jgi:tRNA-dihydrouridine synthase
VRRLVEWGAVGIDINMGCPVTKALRHNYGVALMGDPAYAAEVVRMTVRHAGVPVSVKLRAGLQNDLDFLLRFTRGLEDAGAAWITLHPRVGAQKRRGSADWSQIARVRESLSIPVVGNGDVQTADDVFAMHEATGCDAVMVGRALAARPWLLWQVGERLGWRAPVLHADRVAPRTPDEEGREYGRALEKFVAALEAHFTFEDGFKRLKFHLRMTAGWLEFGHALQAATSRAKSYAEARETIYRFFETPQRMFAKTQLRE